MMGSIMQIYISPLLGGRRAVETTSDKGREIIERFSVVLGENAS